VAPAVADRGALPKLLAAQRPPLGPFDWQPGDHATDAYACRSGRIRRQTAAAGHFLGAIAIQTV